MIPAKYEAEEAEPFALPDAWKQVRYGRKKKIHNISKHTENAWLEDGFLIDSGSGAHIVPQGCVLGSHYTQRNGAKVKFELADGKVIESEGTQTLQCETKEGYAFRIQCHVAPVGMPIMSSGQLLWKGVAILLDPAEQCLHTPGKIKLRLRPVRQTVVLDIKASTFVRQGL